MVKEQRFDKDDCQRVSNLVDDLLSNELAGSITLQVISHVESCPTCREERARREQVRDALKRSWNELQAPVALTQTLREMVPSPPPRRIPWWATVAAGVVLAVAGLTGLLLVQSWPELQSDRPLAVDHFDAVLEDHLNCTGHPLSEEALPLDPEYPRLRQALDRLPEGYRLVGIMECQVRDASFIHYLFRAETGGLLSLMLEERTGSQFLADRGTSGRLNGVRMASFADDELALAGLETPRYFVYVIGDGFDRERVVRLAGDLLPALADVVGLEG